MEFFTDMSWVLRSLWLFRTKDAVSVSALLVVFKLVLSANITAPNAFLCEEVWCIAGIMSSCCSFDVNRRMIWGEYKLGSDPTENRVNDVSTVHTVSQTFGFGDTLLSIRL
jgi:hypothetical protein